MSEQGDPHAGTEGQLDTDTYLERYAGVTGRRELVDGHVVTMAAERVRHTRTRAHVYGAPRVAIVPADRALRLDPPGIELDVAAFFASG